MNDFKCNSSNETTTKYLNAECVNERSNVNIKQKIEVN